MGSLLFTSRGKSPEFFEFVHRALDLPEIIDLRPLRRKHLLYFILLLNKVNSIVPATECQFPTLSAISLQSDVFSFI